MEGCWSAKDSCAHTVQEHQFMQCMLAGLKPMMMLSDMQASISAALAGQYHIADLSGCFQWRSGTHRTLGPASHGVITIHDRVNASNAE